jgi:hypothetical protein
MASDLCPDCLDRKLQGCLGRKVIAENEKRQTVGIFSGFRVDGRALKVVIRERRRFHVIENVTRLSFQDQKCEEIQLLERT